MKKLLLPLAAFTLLAASAQAAVIFDGASNTVLMASTNNNTDVVLGNPSSGTWTLTSAAANQGAYIFGNFTATTLSNVGDSLTLSFTANNWPGAVSPGDQITPISFGLFGAGTSLVTSNTTLGGFSSYEGFARHNGANNVGYNGWTFNATSNLTTAGVAVGTTVTAITGASGSTAASPNRFNYGGTADFTISVTRTLTAFEIGGSINVSGGSGVQNYNVGTFTPGTGFQLSDAFTTLAIGINGTSAANQMNSGAVMNFSGITVDYVAVIPEPSSIALLAGALGGIALLRRRRKA